MYSCKKCHQPIDDIAEAMLQGCECGSRLFSKGEVSDPETSSIGMESQPVTEENQPIIMNEMDEDITIQIRERGVYQVNIKNLANRDSNMDPLFIKDTKGKISVVFNPDA